MLKLVGRVLRLAGEYAGKLRLSLVLSFVESLLLAVPIFMAWYVFSLVLDNALQVRDAWICFSIILGSVLLRMVLRYWFVMLESGTGYEICARERITLGERLRHLPMRFFSEGNLGWITSIITVDLPFVEEMGMDALDKVISGLAGALIGVIMLLSIDWRIGLITVIIYFAAFLTFQRLERVCRRESPIRQKQQAKLVSAVLEYVRGIPVIKAFNMGGDRAKAVKDAIESTRDHSVGFELQSVNPVLWYRACFAVGTAVTILAATLFAINGLLPAPTAIMVFIFVFYLYMPVQAFTNLSSQTRITEAALDRYEDLNAVDMIEDMGKEAVPHRHDITMRDVRFSYGEGQVLDGVSFTAPAKSVTALVGPSGGGKTTIANLIVRFWDVDSGSVEIGGTNVRDIAYDNLLGNVSMVFQNVYLFNDTIRNNIRFGRPEASEEEIIEAAKKARCHEFIMALPDGYNTLAGERGDRLSGGEKQRISIARAILKNAPIILLDEATASVDPDNEGDIQRAIGELIQDKTLIIIAHRLSTIQNAHQILVVDNKRIVEHGTHTELLNQDGVYHELWKHREKAGGWKISR
ncbi:ATP-binding cassette, subfamily B [Sporobacter termitidis DSM 10068]|uniref:ATP-binding cassette, subfamily B n=1 Tax=Sporobacter termitidis DSM 10068 TaxID=1123282 RepID=A0A1M5W528_9FIRM|nr:ABC transporter ATP-binding protein [Sporobacter termitidis]SHH82575.1 ATP-binding cassette, subfamily B [Sporobacter termitidis DSM 10068]